MPKQPIDRGVTRIAPRLCPYCGYHFDAVGTYDGSEGTPGPGDTTVCLNCTAVLTFETTDSLRKLTAEELTALESDDPKWATERAARAQLRAMQQQGFKTAQAARRRGKPQ